MPGPGSVDQGESGVAQAATTTVRFDDLAGLHEAINAGFGPWGPELAITQDMVNAFADLSGDHQWIHVDVERARRESRFGGPIAHGFLTLVLLPRLEARAVEIVGHGSAVNYGGERLRFVSPVPVGAAVRGRARLTRAEPKAAGTLVTTELEVRVSGAERPAMLYEMLALYLP